MLGRKYREDREVVNTSLMQAVRSGRLETVRELINSFGLSDAKSCSGGYVLLCVALKNKHTAVAKLLLTSGSRVNREKRIHNACDTALHLAVINGDMEIVAMILDKGANIDVKNQHGKTPLNIAMENNEIKIAQLILNHRDNVNARDNDGTTSLHVAAKMEYFQIVERRLENGADVKCTCNLRCEKSYTPLHFAVESGKKEVVTLLLSRGANINVQAKNGTTALHIAAACGLTRIAEELLKHGACIHSLTLNKGYTPLHFAIKNKRIAVVKLLLEHGAKVDDQDTDGKTKLYLAVEEGCLMIVQYLLKYCPDINNKTNRSSLKIAVLNCNHGNHKKIVEAIIEYGLIVNPEDANDPKLLHAAVEKGYLKIVEDLLKYGANVNTSHNWISNSYTLLHMAAKNKQEELTRLLISYKADINARDRTGKTPIFYTIDNADVKITKLLLANRANVKDDPELLSIAVKKKCTEIVEALLQHNVDINACDKYGRTALHFTVFSENERSLAFHTNRNLDITVRGEIAKLLLSNGANVNAQTKTGVTTLHGATHEGFAKVVEVLLEYNANVNSVAENDITLLHLSVQKGYAEISRMLLNKGANVNAKQQDDFTALHLATQNGDKAIVQLLLEYGAKVDSKYGNDITPLHLSVQKGYAEISRMLLNKEANVNAKQQDEFTALHLATQNGDKAIVQLLLEYGAKVDSKNGNDITPLHLSVQKRYAEISRMLLNKEANVNAKQSDDFTALHLATQNGDKAIVQLLLEYGAKVDSKNGNDITPLHLSVQKRYAEISRMLLNKGANVNAKQQDEFTALHLATQNGDKAVVKLLLEYGAKGDSKNGNDVTPLHMGAEYGYQEIIQTILKFGVDINCRDKDGRTALHIASHKGHAKVVANLLEYGSDINITSRDDRTALDYAIAALKPFERRLDNDYGIDMPEHSVSTRNETAKTLERHIVKMTTANLYVSEKNLRSMVLSSSMNNFRDKCEREIAGMKNQKIDNANISYYDILAKRISSLAIYMRNENIVQVLKSDDYKNKFPIYASMIGSNFRKSMERIELLEQENNIFHFLFPELPYDCSEKIFSYLSNEDLRILIDACKPLSVGNPDTNIDDPVITSNASQVQYAEGFIGLFKKIYASSYGKWSKLSKLKTEKH